MQRVRISALFVVAALAVAGLGATPAAALPTTTPGGTWSTNGVVWDMVRIGDTIYLGGEFTQVVSPDGAQTLPRANLAAISVSTGRPLAWAPAADGAVLALESSADGSRVYVGGYYNRIAGVTRARLAALRTSDGTLDTAFRATTGGRVRSLLRYGNALFVGGEFVNVGAIRQRLVARVDAVTGAVTPGWDPVLEGGAVRGMVVSPDGGRLYLAGSFTSVDGGANTRYAAAVSPSTGALSSWRAVANQPLFDVAATGDAVYLAVGGPGIPNNRLQKHSATTGAEVFRYIADGDLQDLEIRNSILFVGGHWDTDFGGLDRTMLVAIDLRDDHVLDWSPHVAGLYGVWKIIAGPEGLWAAGQFHHIGDLPRRGFAFLPEAATAAPATRLLVDRFGSWRYRPESAPAGWSASGFDDSGWAAGRAEIGFGDGDEVSPIATTRTLYLRRSFTVTDRTAWRSLHLRLLADAGAAVYLNGVEVARDNLPAGALTATSNALGAKWTRAERSYVEFSVPAARLVNGRNTLAVEVHTTHAGPEDMSFALELLGEPGAPAGGPTGELVGANASWRVLDSGVAPAGAWNTRSFDAAAWRSVRGEMGAGDGDETTVINRLQPAHVTDWFRTWFDVADPSALRSVTLRLLADDGAVVYLNGTEIIRDNLPAGAILPGTLATTARMNADERAWRTFTVPVGLLRTGSNLLAVEVHQTGLYDPDSSLAVQVLAGV